MSEIEFTVGPPPLKRDESGVIRVNGTRIPLEAIVWRFQQGATPEEIVDVFPVLKLPDVYATINFCYQHEAEVRAYVLESEALSEANERLFKKKFEDSALGRR